ncbi:MAG: NDP-sugar synthase [Proteobacteria bacterium]|nr:NDP-sugar synthase [Pseudomonadota bacterium]
MRAMILAAGFGTRLRPITDTLPKSLVPVVGVPNIVRSINHLASAGIREIVINSCYLSDILEDALGDGSSLGVAIAYSREQDPLGTGGGIKKALPLLGDKTFIVVNGDALFTPDIEWAIRAHLRKGALATLLVREDPQVEAYGAVGLDAEDRICRLVWAGNANRAIKSCMFTGFHIIEPDICKQLPQNGCIVRETYIPAIERGAPLFGLTTKSTFFDLGTPERYLKANIALVTGQSRIAGFDPPSNKIYVGQDVELGKHCRLGHGAVICNGASIKSGVHIERSVVMPGAIVEKDILNAIVTGESEVLF